MWRRLIWLALIVGLAGAWLTLVGGFQSFGRYVEYTIGFSHAGDSCGVHWVQLDTESGQQLFCASRSVSSTSSPPEADAVEAFRGFTAEQNARVLTLAVERARGGGMTKADQDAIQAVVDGYAAPLLDAHGFWWGTNNLIIGLGAAALGIFLYVVATRRDDAGAGPGVPLADWRRR